MRSSREQNGAFLAGLGWGLAASTGFLLLLPLLWPGAEKTVVLANMAGPLLPQAWQELNRNLQGSLVPFALVLVVYFSQLRRLQVLLRAEQPAAGKVVRHEQLLDLSANLFFGIGVIWTAIGMRDALIHGLGDPVVSATAGAFSVLQRLVDGGILLALSTTIVGGAGGYLMRIIKSVVLGEKLTALYIRESQGPADAGLAALERIEQHLQTAAKQNAEPG
jgi:hypothetical protein